MASPNRKNAKSNAKSRSQTFHGTEPHLKLVTTDVPPVASTTQPIVLTAKSANQRFFLKTLTHGSEPIIIAHGPAGTGKSYLAMTYALQQLREGHIKKIVITRPTVTSGDEDYGYLPGTLTEKLAPWVRPLLDIAKKYYTVQQVERMIEDEVIEVAGLGFMRGRTLDDCIIIGDEMQNTEPGQLRMLMTRIGENSRMIVTGDIEQHDRGHAVSGLKFLLDRLARDEPAQGEIAMHEFSVKDVVRHPVIGTVLRLFS